MNLYFIVEGRRTEAIVYPAWLSILVPELERVYDPFKIEDNQYYLFNCGGYPGILNDMINSIYDINAIGKFDYLVICLDADDESIETRVSEVKERIMQEGVLLSCELVVIVQKKCIETWFLGNRKMYTKRPRGNFRYFLEFYDVSLLDPEEMEKPKKFNSSTAQFHFKYLDYMLREKKLRYSKGKPYVVCSDDYLAGLVNRIESSYDLGSFKYFIDFCRKIRADIQRGV